MTLPDALAASLDHLKRQEEAGKEGLAGKFARARELAAQGLGVDDVMVRVGLTRSEAKIIVLGKGSQR